MRIASACFTIALLSSLAQCQEGGLPHTQPRGKPDDTCTVEGVVLKSTTSEPLKKATVSLYSVDGSGQNRVASSDASGRFRFADVPPGRYRLQAQADGYVAQSVGQRRSRGAGITINLTPGRQERDLVFRLTPEGVISGKVFDEDGDPLRGARVGGMLFVSRGGRRQLLPAGQTQTNDLGEYRLFGIPAGRYYVFAIHSQRVFQKGGEDEIYLPTFYPGATDATQASPVEVRSGEEVPGINLNLSTVRGVRVRGRVLDEASNRPLQNSYVRLLPRDSSFLGYMGGNLGASASDPQGNFEVRGVPQGAYSLQANWQVKDRSYSSRIPLDVGTADLDGIIITVGPPSDLRGRVLTDPPAKLDFAKLGIWLESTDQPGGSGNPEFKPDGSFIIKNIIDGAYRLHLSGFPEEFYLRSARLGGADVLEGGLSVSHTQSTGTLELVLTLNGGRIDGTVVSRQQPFSGALVTLIPNPPNRDRDELYSSTTSDQLGRFSMPGLPPGDYKLFAWEEIEGESFKDSEFLKTYESQGKPVHIREREQQAVQLDLIPAEENTE